MKMKDKKADQIAKRKMHLENLKSNRRNEPVLDRNEPSKLEKPTILIVCEGKITKIGQFPQLADLENTHLKKYKELNNEIYQELNRATGLNSHGIGVGSFVYLRRIIEKYIVYPELEKLIQDNLITEDQVNLTDFKGKVVLAKEHLPDVLVDNPRIYSILSKGIHSLSEKDCLEIFDPLLTAIELILDEQLEKVERTKKLKKMKDDLNKIAN